MNLPSQLAIIWRDVTYNPEVLFFVIRQTLDLQDNKK